MFLSRKYGIEILIFVSDPIVGLDLVNRDHDYMNGIGMNRIDCCYANVELFLFK